MIERFFKLLTVFMVLNPIFIFFQNFVSPSQKVELGDNGSQYSETILSSKEEAAISPDVITKEVKPDSLPVSEDLNKTTTK
jgi:hypothetical protein